MTPFDYFAQGLGILASAAVIVSFSQKCDQRFRVTMICGAALFAFHFALLGAYAGAIVATINAVRIAFSMKFHGSSRMMVGFISLYLLAGFFVYEKPSDLLPIFSGALATFSMFKLSGIKMRAMFLCTECCWVAYNLIVKSIGGLITNAFVFSTNATTIYRLIKEKKEEESDVSIL